MLRWLAKRIIAAALVIFVVTSLVFVVTHIFTDPATMSLPLEATEEHRASRRAVLGLDRPLSVQYWDFISAWWSVTSASRSGRANPPRS